jgi:hypothetical protein
MTDRDRLVREDVPVVFDEHLRRTRGVFGNQTQLRRRRIHREGGQLAGEFPRRPIARGRSCDPLWGQGGVGCHDRAGRAPGEAP